MSDRPGCFGKRRAGDPNGARYNPPAPPYVRYEKTRLYDRVARAVQEGDTAHLSVEGPEGAYGLSAPWAVACDGAGSAVRRMLGIERRGRDYGTDSAVADFEMDCDLPKDVSRIVLDPRRPYGFFYFAQGRWRLVYRINGGEDRQAMTTEGVATELLRSKLGGARVHRFLWASAFRLGQGQSETYRNGR